MDDVSDRPCIMGIINATPDSFSDGGLYSTVEAAISRGIKLVDQGADWLDVGGESTRPGSVGVSTAVELDRVVPVIELLRKHLPSTPISIDTQKPAVAKRALEVGATAVNDVSGLRDPEMVALCRSAACPVFVMHMRGTPLTMQQNTDYDDLVAEVFGWLEARASQLESQGIQRRHIWLDPGLGFGKPVSQNAQIIQQLPRLCSVGYPVLVGASRKRFIGALTGVEQPEQRTFGSIGAACAAVLAGASMLRVHDVASTRQALTVFEACR